MSGVDSVADQKINEKLKEIIEIRNLDSEEISDNKSPIIGCNTLIYGVPGSGKSYTIETQYISDLSRSERIVFHPDYMNTDFIGQIMPTINDDKTITYEFIPGPFTRVMKKAYENPNQHYFLIIEEINRGNAPAIFGEVFQLLDRENSGISSYFITNYNIANEVYGDKEQPVRIPSNLSIIATMNTADQNVFTLDTAFQRRWTMRMIENNVSEAVHAEMEILDTGISWEQFSETVNNQILNNNFSSLSSEDKRLGAYFISKKDLQDDIDNYREYKDSTTSKFSSLFAEKVIKYLWDDAFKFSRENFFNSSYKSLDEVIKDFSMNEHTNRLDVFNTDMRDILKEKSKVSELKKEAVVNE